MTDRIEVTALHHPSTTKVGKVYAGTPASPAHLTVHGPNSPGAGGTLNFLKNPGEVNKKLREKVMKGGYTNIPFTSLPKTMIANIETAIRKAQPELAAMVLTPTADGFDVTDPSGGPSGSASPESASRPRRRRQKNVAVWIRPGSP